MNSIFLAVLAASLAFGETGASRSTETFVTLTRSDDLGIDPARVSDGGSRSLAGNVYETLVARKAGTRGEFEARLATTVPSRDNGLVSADGRTWRFPIRNGVRFHDGRLLTPEDVRFSLIRRFIITTSETLSDELLRIVLGLDPEPDRTVAPGRVLRLAEAAVTVDAGAVVVRLAKPSPSFLAILAADGWVVSKAWCAARGDWDGTAAGLTRVVGPEASRVLTDAADGTGPFRLARWDRAQREIVLERHDAYWRGPARLSRVILKAVPETTTRVLMLQNGDADAVAASVVEEPLFRGLPDVDVSGDYIQPNRFPIVFFNFRIDAAGNPDIGTGELDGDGIPPNFFADQDVRLGFAYSFDPERYIREVLRGRGRPASGFLPPDMPGYSTKGFEFRLDRAKAERHFRRAFGGKLWDKGFKMRVLVNAGSAWRGALVEMLRKQLSSINPKFQMEARVVDWSTLLDRAGRHQTTLYVQGIWEPAADPLLYARALLHSRGRMSSRMRYADPRADALVERAEAGLSGAELEEALTRLQEFARREAVFVPAAEPRGDVLRVQRRWVKGYVFTPYDPGAPESSDYYRLRKEP